MTVSRRQCHDNLLFRGFFGLVLQGHAKVPHVEHDCDDGRGP